MKLLNKTFDDRCLEIGKKWKQIFKGELTMKKLRNFKCGSCNKRYEKLANDDVKAIDCECGSKALRVLSAPRCFGNTTGKSPATRY